MKNIIRYGNLILGCLIFKNTVYASCSISAFTNNKYLDMFTEFELTDENSKDKEEVAIY